MTSFCIFLNLLFISICKVFVNKSFRQHHQVLMAQQKKQHNILDMTGKENDDPNPNRRRRLIKAKDRPTGEVCFNDDCDGIMIHIQFTMQPSRAKLCSNCASWITSGIFTECMSVECPLLLCETCYGTHNHTRRKANKNDEKEEVQSESDPEEEAYLQKILNKTKDTTKQ